MLKVCIFGTRAILVGLAIAASTILFNLRLWPFELFHHFILHFFLLSVFFIIACLIYRAKMEMALFSSLIFIFGVSFWSVYDAARVGRESTTKLPNKKYTRKKHESTACDRFRSSTFEGRVVFTKVNSKTCNGISLLSLANRDRSCTQTENSIAAIVYFQLAA
jgi:hypothetical protein